MTQTAIQRIFMPFKQVLPGWMHDRTRSIATAFIGPILAAHRTGYFRSALKMAAVSKNGQPLPWYTYSAIDFLKYRNYEEKTVLEFGGGQSTLWWASQARHVISLEGDRQWYEKIKSQVPSNVDLRFVSMENKEKNVAEVTRELEGRKISKYDIIIIDGLYRREMIPIAVDHLADDGIIICDNAEGYGFWEGFKESSLWRVDFFGNAPGVVLPHATSIFFRPSSCFIFNVKHPIPVIAKEP